MRCRLSERRHLGAASGEYHVHRDIFRGGSRSLSSASQNIFGATTVITQAPPLVLLPFSPRRFGRENIRRSFAEREENRASLAKYEDVFVPRRARMLINVSISCHQLYCYTPVDRAMSKNKKRNKKKEPR
ncbi:hypothetical protein PUN28_000603 [Cardiocondyla obscurior]|uniref:Uncharacterized protein n=1 Tax=Cardiocondyla obscurior TaxID=286306 RepID=A0AAW2H0B4_9HYME